MDYTEFMEKWESYIEDGHYGLDITTPKVLSYLDKEFEKEIKINPGFTFSQIKLKFGMIRIYTSSDNNDRWEHHITKNLLK